MTTERKNAIKLNAKNLESIKSFCHDIPLIPKLIQSLELFSQEKNWKVWYDGLGHRLEINDNKEIKIVEDKTQELSLSDLFYLAPPAKIAELSSEVIVLYSGKQIQTFWMDQDDGRLRTLIYSSQSWRHFPSLSLNKSLILKIIQGFEDKNLQDGWFSIWPLEFSIHLKMKTANSDLTNIFDSTFIQ